MSLPERGLSAMLTVSVMRVWHNSAPKPGGELPAMSCDMRRRESNRVKQVATLDTPLQHVLERPQSIFERERSSQGE